MGIKKFQEDLKKGMTIETALKEHNLTFKEAVELCPRPFCYQRPKTKKIKKGETYKSVDRHIKLRNNSYCVTKTFKSKSYWGGSYNTLQDAILVRDFLEEHGWNPVKINEACKKYKINRRRGR